MTVEEILKQTGLNDEQIAALDAKVVSAFGGVLSAAEQERQAGTQAAAKAEQDRQAAAKAAEEAEKQRVATVAVKEAAEVARRANEEFYDQTIAPALNNWGTEKANLEAQAAFYRAQNEAARQAGFVPTEAPAFQAQPAATGATTQTRDAQGRYVSGAPGSVPGSPTFTIEDVKNGLGSTLGTLTDIQWKYQSLFGKPMPIPPTELVRQAEAVKLDPAAYAARTFGFAEKEAEMARKTQEDHDKQVAELATKPYEQKLAEAEAAAKKAVEDNDRKWAEKIGSNPDVRLVQPSRFTEVARAVKSGERPDPLLLNESQRRQATATAIRHEIAEQPAA